jgi:TolB-like protein/DNA-binding winged helix-turn-helix (wHTH) protein/Flp pilus assembly protein TadD
MSNSEQTGSIIRFQGFELNLQSGELRKNGNRIKLQDQPFRVLVALLQRPSQVVTREDLRRLIWPEESIGDFDHAINLAIGKLRSSLGDSAEVPHLIETLPRRGYRFIAPVEIESERKPPQRLARWKIVLPIAVVVLVGVTVVVGSVWRFLRPHSAEAATIHSIAVLSFANGSKDPEIDYLAEGLSAEITNSLSRLQNLQVIARSTVSRYQSKQNDAQEVGRNLHVDAVLTGRVGEHGNELDVETELVSVATGAQLWGERFKRRDNDASLLQSAITAKLADRLRPGLSETQRQSLAKVGTRDPDAYALYLKGRYHVEKYTQAEFFAGVEDFHRATNLDPKYASAYAELSIAYAMVDDVFLSPNEAMPIATEAAKKALELDESLPESHMAVALVDFNYNYDWDGAERELQRAIELAPSNREVHQFYGWLLTTMGRSEKAIEESRHAVEIEPLSIDANTTLGSTLYYAHRYDQAIKQLRRVSELDPDYGYSHMFLGAAYEQQGELAAALEELQKANLLQDEMPWTLGQLGHAYARSGRKSEAEQVLKEFMRRSEHGYVPAYDIAMVYAGLGRKEQALKLLEKAYSDRCSTLMFVKVDPALDSLHSDPRFVDLLRRMNFPP